MKKDSAFHFAYGDHPSHFGILRMPEVSGPCPVVVSIHGGFWRSKFEYDLNEPLAEDLTRRGYATWNIEYRRVGQDGGGWTGTFQDVIDAVNYLVKLKERFPLDLSQVVVMGHSAGGHLALWLASRTNNNREDEMSSPLFVPILGVISLAGVADLRRMWTIHFEKGIDSPVEAFIGGTPEQVPNRYNSASPMALLPLNVAQVLIHGDQDLNVPVEISTEYYRRAIEKGDKVTLVVLQDVEHFMIIDPASSVWNAVIASLESLLKA